MAHRIEVELTSQPDQSTWTWRAAGAKQPRGTLDAALVPEGSGVGSVLRAEVETTLDGTTVTALLPLKGGDTRRIETIEVLGSPRRGPDVNVVLATKARRRGEERPDRTRQETRRPRGEGGREEERRDGRRGARTQRVAEEGPSRRRTAPSRPGSREARGREGPRRLTPSSTYRNAALATLKPEEIPVAEQLLRGGIPAVRQALEEQNARARADSRPEVTPGPLLAMAESLLPLVNLAAWKDRASAARAAGKDVSLRELRSLVAASSTVSLDEEGAEMVTALRTALDQRVTALRERWVDRITSALDEDRVTDAVRASVRPPEPSTRLSAELAVRLAEAAGKAMAPDTPPEEWLSLLGAVVDSPVRRTVKPVGLPAEPDEQVLAAARKASGYVPELARLMGIPIPPPPGPRRPVPARSGPGRRTA